jgi:hypothetical protein
MEIRETGYADKPWKTMDGYLFGTYEAAQDWIDRRAEYHAAMQPLWDLTALDRETYERLCAERGVATRSDQDIERNYGIRYGDFAINPVASRGDTLNTCVGMRLHYLRMKALDDVKAKSIPRQPDYPDGRVLDCGCTIFFKSEVMNASLGTSCSDCYDRMSG